jgi:predicted transcriptional regulator of viral defense system
MSESAAERAKETFQKHGGIMRMADALRAGINRNVLYAMRDAGELEVLARGLYRLASLEPLSSPDLATVAKKAPHAVVYLISALAFHELTTQIPHEIWIAVPRNSEPPRLDYPPLRITRLSDKSYQLGIESHTLDGMAIKVYSREKTLIDCFKRRNEIGLDVVLEAVRAYRSQGNTDVEKLMSLAHELRVARIAQPYLEAIL